MADVTTVFVLTLVLFLQGGLVVSQSGTGPDLESCEAARQPIADSYVGKKQKVQMADGSEQELLVLDAQTLPCVKVTQQEHA